MVDKNSAGAPPGPAVAGTDDAHVSLLAVAVRDLALILRGPATALDAARLRYRRPGPKSWAQRRARHGPRPGERLPAVDPAVTDLDLPITLPGQHTAPAADHPFGFRSVFYYRDGRPIATQPEAAYFAALRDLEDLRRRRVAVTVLHDAGTRIRVSTVFLGRDASSGGHHPPLLFQTMLFLGPGTGRGAAEWNYATEAAARHGHTAVVAALRAARAARHPARRRTPSTAGPWRHGYRRR